MDLKILQQEYLQLVNVILPSIAVAKGFPVHLNHCFQRICLDNLFGGCWYDFLIVGKIAAYKQLDVTQLQQLTNITQSLVDRDCNHINLLNQQSLQWRKSRRNSDNL